MTPKVSIGLPVYNGEQFLSSALAALLRQDHENIEVIISDNASTDGTEEICRRMAGTDSRISYHRAPRNRGLAWNWNRCVPLATGDFFKWAAADDEHHPSYVSRTLERLTSEADIALVHSRTRDMDETGRDLGELVTDIRMDAPTPHERFRELTRKGWPSVQVFGLVRTSVLRQTGLHGAYPRSDRALLAELGLHGRLVTVDDELFRRREYAGRVTRSTDLRSRYPVFTGEAVPARVFPQWRLLRGFLAAVRRAPLPPVERARCMWALEEFVRKSRGTLRREALSLLPSRT